jgi:hypothetical protein
MYLSLLERDACGPPSDEKLLNLSEALGEPHPEIFFAKAGRVTPQVVNTILRHPTQWSELIEAAKDLDADHLAGLTVILHQGAGKSHLGKFIADLLKKESQRTQESEGRNLQRDTKKRTAPKEARVSSARRGKGVSHAPRLLTGQTGRP